jgi:molybdopterin/thiamine biosynthesis adenylyltransferase/molybdopterin converting factor small subunit
VSLERARVLVVGLGGLGCPALLALARAGVGTLGLCDDDGVDATNLHRQILYRESDVGSDKVDAAARALVAIAPRLELRPYRTRLLPANAAQLVRAGWDVVLEGADNFATKFLAADACGAAGVPVVHASSVRWVGTALAVGARGRPCYRCLFEDVPDGDAPNCAEAGVMGPVVGLTAAAQVDLALALLAGSTVAGTLVTVDGKSGTLRRRAVPPRADCSLCGVEKRRAMETIVRIPTPLRTLTGGADEVKASGATVGDVIEDLERKHPGIRDRLLDDKGVRRFVNIYVGEEDVRFLEGLKTQLKAGDQISIVPAIAGG